MNSSDSCWKSDVWLRETEGVGELRTSLFFWDPPAEDTWNTDDYKNQALRGVIS